MRKTNKRRLLFIGTSLGLVIFGGSVALWLGNTASRINSELTSAHYLIPALKSDLGSGNADGAAATAEQLRRHTSSAKEAADHPVWTLASTLPALGSNFSAVAEVARTADDVVGLGLIPLVKVYGTLDWELLLPSRSGTNLEPLKAASPSITTAADTVRLSADRLARIDTTKLVPQVAEPLTSARDQLQDITHTLDAAADAALVIPEMLGAETQRDYLLIIQNSAESRASGGIPGALAVLSLKNGGITLGSQSSASEVGVLSPPVSVDPEQQNIYSNRLGRFMQDVNLTPHFPTAGSTAQAMWERKTGQRVHGVISIDPVALSFILRATGPVKITNPELRELATAGLPTELSSENVVKTLLADVYARVEQPALQDAYFASVAQEVFNVLSNGAGNEKAVIQGLTRGSADGRILVWSGVPAEQDIIAKYALSGSIAGPSVAPAQFGVYFNDGTGAKMDYYIRRKVQLIKECSRGDYEQTTVRVTSTNTAPLDAATSLPKYVTGGSTFGVPAGSVQTNIAAYGPVQAVVETAKFDGQQVGFAPYLHANRPVGVVAIRLAPGETRTVDMTFGRIVQHTEPNVVVTPTVQDVNDVLLPTRSASCG